MRKFRVKWQIRKQRLYLNIFSPLSAFLDGVQRSPPFAGLSIHTACSPAQVCTEFKEIIPHCCDFSWSRADFAFIVSGKMLCVGVRRKAILLTQECFSCCCWAVLYGAKNTSVSQLFALSYQWKGLNGHRRQNQDSWPKLAKGTCYPVWHHAEEKNYLKNGRIDWAAIAWSLAGLWSASGKQLHCALFVLLYTYIQREREIVTIIPFFPFSLF